MSIFTKTRGGKYTYLSVSLTEVLGIVLTLKLRCVQWDVW